MTNTNKEVFDLINTKDELEWDAPKSKSDNTAIEWSQPDYTGKSADYYLHKYVNRPEDSGNLEKIQEVLDYAGIVAPPADALNAAIFLAKGEYGMAGLSMASVVPFIGEIKKGWKALTKGLGLGEEYVTLWRGVKTDDIDKMVDGKNIYGNWGTSSYARSNQPYNASHKAGYANNNRWKFDGVIAKNGDMVLSTLPNTVDVNKILFTTNDKKEALRYVMGGGQNGFLLEFKVPKSFVTRHGRNAFGNKWNMFGGEYLDKQSLETLNNIYPSTIFTEGLPSKFLHRTFDIGRTPVNDAQKALFKEHAYRKTIGNAADIKWVGDDIPDFKKIIEKYLK